MTRYQQSTTTYPHRFLMRDAAGDALTGLAPSVTLLKVGEVAYAAAAGVVSELGGGEYSLAWHADDLDTLGSMSVKIEAAGAITLWGSVQVVAFDPMALLDAAGTRAALGMASANLDTQLTALPGAVEAALVNAGDGTDLLQLVADKLAGDLTATDLTAVAIAAACRDATLDAVLAGSHDVVGSLGKLAQALATVASEEDFKVVRAVLAGLRTLTDNGDGTKTARHFDADGVTPKIDLTFNAKGVVTVSEVDPA